jgi:hypothetical protein
MLSNSTSPALIGYQIADEPLVADIPELKILTESIAEARPGKLRYINMNPNYADIDALNRGNTLTKNVTSYPEYIDRFIKDVKPDVLSFDHYPSFSMDDAQVEWKAEDDVWSTAPISRAGYRANLALFRDRSMKHKIPFWNFMHVGGLPGSWTPDPTDAQVAWQVFTSMAYGAKGILYFIYWSAAQYGVGGTSRGGGIISPQSAHHLEYNDTNLYKFYKPTPHYEQVRRLNSILRIFGKVSRIPPPLMTTAYSLVVLSCSRRVTQYLFSAKSVGVWHLPGQASGNITAKTNGNSNSTPCVVSYIGGGGEVKASAQDRTSSGYLLGQFVLDDGRTALLLQNQDDRTSLWPKLNFSNEIRRERDVLEVDQISGEEATLFDDAPEEPGLQLLLSPGHARLLLFKGPDPPN